MKLAEDILKELLRRWPIARLATVSADGRPHVVPLVFCEHGGVVYSPFDRKRKSGGRLQRFANLAANPRAALLLDAYTADWQQLWWVRIDGDGDWFEPDAGDAEEISTRLLEKYPQYRNPALRFDARAYLRLRPISVAAWAQSDSPETIRAAAGGE